MAPQTSPTGPFREDARFERTAKVADPNVLGRIAMPRAPFLFYALFVVLFTVVLSEVLGAGFGTLMIYAVAPLAIPLFRRRASGSTGVYGECAMGPAGIRCEQLEQITEHAFESVRRVRVSGRYVVLWLRGDEPLVLEPSSDPGELARWIEDRVPSRTMHAGAVLVALGLVFVLLQLGLLFL